MKAIVQYYPRKESTLLWMVGVLSAPGNMPEGFCLNRHGQEQLRLLIESGFCPTAEDIDGALNAQQNRRENS